MISLWFLWPFSKIFWQWSILMFMVFLTLPCTTEKDQSVVFLYSNELKGKLTLSEEYLPDCYYQKIQSILNVISFRLQQLFKVTLYIIMEINELSLNSTLRMTMASQLSDSSVKQEDLEHMNLVIGHPGLQKESTGLRSSSCQLDYVFYVGSVSTPSPFLIPTLILIYSHYQVTLLRRASYLVVWNSHKEKRSLTADSFMMPPSSVILSLSAMGVSTVIGFFANLFIVVALCMEKTEGKEKSPRERILFTLGLFNIMFQCTMVANDTTMFLWSDLYYTVNVFATFSIILFFTVFSSFWFTFCLSAFYYVMLITTKNTFIMRVKQSISKVVPWMLIASVLLSLTISVPVAWNITQCDNSDQLNRTLNCNITVVDNIPFIDQGLLLASSLIGCCVPLILVSVANVLIIKSLWVHAKNLGKTAGRMSVQSVDASISAARTLTSLLLLYFCFYISEFILILNMVDLKGFWASVCLVMVYSYPPVQSFILILGSPKLKVLTMRILCSLRLPGKSTPTKRPETLNSSVSSLPSVSTG